MSAPKPENVIVLRGTAGDWREAVRDLDGTIVLVPDKETPPFTDIEIPELGTTVRFEATSDFEYIDSGPSLTRGCVAQVFRPDGAAV